MFVYPDPGAQITGGGAEGAIAPPNHLNMKKRPPPIGPPFHPLRPDIGRTPSTTRNFIDYPTLEIGPENSLNYPPSKLGRKSPSITPLEFTELHRLPPSKLGRKTLSTTPTTPPRNWAGKVPQLPPLEFTELHRLPPSRNWAGKLSQLPPPLEFTELLSTTREGGGKGGKLAPPTKTSKLFCPPPQHKSQICGPAQTSYIKQNIPCRISWW